MIDGMDGPVQTAKRQKDEIPMVPKHWAEMSIAHMSRALRIVVIGFSIGFVCMVLMALIFVTGYTSRTKDWLNTLAGMQGQPAVTEVTDGQQTDP